MASLGLNMKNTVELILIKQLNGHSCKINPLQIVRVDPRTSNDGFKKSYSITLSTSQIIDFSSLDKENKEIMEIVEPTKKKKVV